jgi:hypothetical protein
MKITKITKKTNQSFSAFFVDFVSFVAAAVGRSQSLSRIGASSQPSNQRAVNCTAVVNFGSMSTGTPVRRSSTFCTSGRTTPRRSIISFALA